MSPYRQLLCAVIMVGGSVSKVSSQMKPTTARQVTSHLEIDREYLARLPSQIFCTKCNENSAIYLFVQEELNAHAMLIVKARTILLHSHHCQRTDRHDLLQ